MAAIDRLTDTFSKNAFSLCTCRKKIETDDKLIK